MSHLKLVHNVTDAEFRQFFSIENCAWLDCSECRSLTDLAFLFTSSSILSLDISFITNITDLTLQSVANGMKNLTHIAMNGCINVSDNGLGLLSDCIYLKSVSIKYSNVTDAGIEFMVCGLSNLSSLYLDYCPISDRALFGLSNHCDQLTHIDCSSCKKVSDIGVVRLVGSCRNLKYVSFDDCPLITDASILAISTVLFSLTHLGLSGATKVTDKAITFLEKHCLSLQFVDLSFCPFITMPHFVKYVPVSKDDPFQSADVSELRPSISEQCCKAIKDHRVLTGTPSISSSHSTASGQSNPSEVASSASTQLRVSVPIVGAAAGGKLLRRNGYLAKNTKVDFWMSPPYIPSTYVSSSRKDVAAKTAATRIAASKADMLRDREIGGSRSDSRGRSSTSWIQASKKVIKPHMVSGKICKNHLNGLYDIEYSFYEPKCKPSQIRLPAGNNSRYVKGKMEHAMVEANFREHGCWLPGKIIKERLDTGTFDIQFSLCEATEVPEKDIMVGGMTVDEYLTSATRGPNSALSAGLPLHTTSSEMKGRMWLQSISNGTASVDNNGTTSRPGIEKGWFEYVPAHSMSDPNYCLVLRT